MGWKIANWICGGFRAMRADGEMVFVYRRLDWSPSRYMRSYCAYEFRWRGIIAARLAADGIWLRRARLLYAPDGRPVINDQDLVEIAGLMAKTLN